MSHNGEKGDDYYDLSPEETSDPNWLEKLLKAEPPKTLLEERTEDE